MHRFIVSALFLCLSLPVAFASPVFAAGCSDNSSFFGLRPWYATLDLQEDSSGHCEISSTNFAEDQLGTTIWAIILTILSDLFFVAGLASVVMVIVSGLKYILSTGNVSAAMKARNTLIASLVGLLIVLVADLIVNTILGLF